MPAPLEPVLLETERLVLRELSLADAAAVFRNLSDADTARYFVTPFTHPRQAEQHVRALMDERRQGRGITWALALKPDLAVLGTCGYWIKTWDCGEINFDLARDQWGRGLMREALVAALAAGFERMGFARVEAYTHPANHRAVALLTGLGFQMDEAQGDRHLLSLSAGRWRFPTTGA